MRRAVFAGLALFVAGIANATEVKEDVLVSSPNGRIGVHFGIDAAGPYYTMELLEGSDLRESAPLPWTEVCALLRDVAAALALLHSRRLLHRDISPRNVYRVRGGRTKLIDFGAMSPMVVGGLTEPVMRLNGPPAPNVL